MKLNAQFQFNQRNDPQEWCAAISFACNNHIRRNGFTPYQYVIGKSPRIPKSLVEVMGRRTIADSGANSAALFEDGPRRAEQIRAAANRAFFELDTDDAVRRALVGRVRPPRGPFSSWTTCVLLAELSHEGFFQEDAGVTRMERTLYCAGTRGKFQVAFGVIVEYRCWSRLNRRGMHQGTKPSSLHMKIFCVN